VLRVTNLARKAHCLLAKERWADGRRVDTRQHAAGAARRGLPFLVLRSHRLDLAEILWLLRPVLVAKGLVREPPGRQRGGGGGGERAGGFAAWRAPPLEGGWGEGEEEEEEEAAEQAEERWRGGGL
jgi:hypothetical protein